MRIPFYTGEHQNQRLEAKLNERLRRVVQSGSYILGKEVRELEERIAEFAKVKHAIGVANGSDALLLAVQALELEPGSEVITTPFTFFASTACIARGGHKPVFVDVDAKTFNIDPSKIPASVTSKTKAILPVDLFAQMAEYDQIIPIAKEYNLKIIEDSAESFGMSYAGLTAGSAGDVGVYSFFPTKTLGCFGDGGMVTTNDDRLAEIIKKCRVHGSGKKYHHDYIGMNSRLDEIQAAVLNVKMDYILGDIEERAKIAALYKDRLQNIPQISLPLIDSKASPVWYVFSLQCENRNALQAYLQEQGIGTSIYYPIPMHLQECFKYLGYKKGDFPVAENLCDRALALPIYIGMTEDQVDQVCGAVKSFYQRH